MRKKLRLTVSVCLLVCGFVIIPKWWASLSESRLHDRINHRLLDRLPELAGEDWRIYLDGSEGIVHGTVSSQSLYREVNELIGKLSGDGPEAIRGLEVLECALTIPHRSSLDLSIDDDSGRITIVGEIPPAADAILSAALKGAFPQGSIEKKIQISSGLVSAAPWAGPLGELIPTLVNSVGELSVRLDGRALTINGRVSSEHTRIGIQQLLLERLAGSVDYVSNGLTTLEGELETSFLTVEFTSADTIVLHGRVHSKSARDQLVRGVEAIAPAGFLVETRLRVRPAAAGSWWTRPTLAFLPIAFESLQGGELRVDATGLRISAASAADPEAQRKLEALAKNYFPEDLYALASKFDPLPEPPPAAETAVALVANIPAPQPTSPTLATVEATTAIPDPVPDPDPDPDPSPITVRPADPILAETSDTSEFEQLINDTQIFFSSGSTRIRETESEKIATLAEKLANSPEIKLDISGLADPVGNAAANRRLAKRRCTSVLIALEESGIDPSRLQVIGGGEKSPTPGEPSWKLRRVEFAIHKLPPEPAVTPTEQGSGWRESIATTQIYFDNSSTRLTLEERSKLDRVAALLKQDTPGVLGISGFADPYGNRDYNERLCKLRCQTVHDYLIEQGVPATRLKTQPGGELTNADAGDPTWKKRRVQFQWIELAASR